MQLTLFHSLLAFSLSITQVILVGASPTDPSIEQRSQSSELRKALPHRRMVAARSKSSLKTRNEETDSFLKHEHVLPFIVGDASVSQIKESLTESRSPFAANVRLKSILPTMLLEEHERLIEQITCYHSRIELDFHDTAASSSAWMEFVKYPELLVITSHYACNADGERAPYIVSNVWKREHILVLAVVPTTWRRSFHSIDINFGSRIENGRLERREHLGKRQAVVRTTASAAASPSVVFPSPPTSSPTATSIVGANLTMSWMDTAILPPSFPGANLVVPDLPGGLTVKCKNCTLQGNIDLSHGLLGISEPSNNTNDNSEIDPAVQEAFNFYKNGYLELVVNDFAAHIELESTVTPTASLVTYIAPFPDIGIPGWIIPNIAEVGPVLRPRVTFGVQLSIELDFIYGFDLTVPNNSTIRLDIADPVTNSNITGFQNATFSAIPFQAQVDNISLTVTAAFNPEILLTVSVLGGDGEISAGAFLDLPKVSATVAQVDHVDQNCNPTNSSDKIKDFLDHSLTNIVPTVDFDVGVLVDGNLNADGFSTDVGASTTALSSGYPLPTTCIAYDSAHKTYGPPARATKAGSASASLRGSNPLTDFLSKSGTVVVVGMIMWVLYMV